MSKFNLPHKANVGEIIRVKGYEGILFLVTEWTEEVMHEKDGTIAETVTYTCQNIDNHKEVKIVFDQDVQSIVVTADKSKAYMQNRKDSALPPAVQHKGNVGDLKIDISALLRMFEENRKAREAANPVKSMNAPRSQWQKEREEKRKAYEYIDFLLERYADLVSMQQVMPNDKEIQAEIDLVKSEFMEKTGMKVIQDGKFS